MKADDKLDFPRALMELWDTKLKVMVLLENNVCNILLGRGFVNRRTGGDSRFRDGT